MLLILLVSAWASAAVSATNSIESSAFFKGSYVTNKGRRNLRGTTIIVPISLLNPAYAQGALTLAEELLRKVARIEGHQKTTARVNALRASLQHYNQSLTTLISTPKNQSHPGPSILENINKTRSRRSLFNLGGQALRYVFGVATQDEVKTLESSIANTTGFLTTTTTMLRMETETLKEVIKHLSEAIESELSVTNHALNTFRRDIHTNRQLGLIGDLILSVDSVVDKVQSQVAALRAGQIEHLISKNELSRILNETSSQIPPVEKFFCNLTEEWHFIARHLLVRHTQSPMIFALHLPFVQVESYEVSEIATLPQQDYQGNWFAIQLKNNVIGVGKTHFFAENSIQCNDLFCENTLQNGLKNISENHCGLQILSNNGTPHCALTPLPQDASYKITTLSAEWIISLLSPTKIEIDCPKTKTIQRLEATGNFAVQKTCNFYSDFVSFLGRRQIRKETIYTRSSPFTFAESEKAVNSQDSNLNKLGEIARSVGRLRKSLENNITHIEIRQTHLQIKSHLQLGTGLGIAGLLCILLVAASLYFRRRMLDLVQHQIQARNVASVRRTGTL